MRNKTKPKVPLLWPRITLLFAFIGATVIAASIFVAVKVIHHFRQKAEEQPAASPPPRQEQLLEEIRDLLKKRSS